MHESWVGQVRYKQQPAAVLDCVLPAAKGREDLALDVLRLAIPEYTSIIWAAVKAGALLDFLECAAPGSRVCNVRPCQPYHGMHTSGSDYVGCPASPTEACTVSVRM